MRRIQLLVATMVTCCAIAISSRATASPTARLVYVRGAGADACPDEEALKQSVAARLGYDPFRPFVSNVLYAEIKSEKGRFVGNVRVIDETGIERGTRTIESRAPNGDCTEIAASMALSISIAIDPRSAFHPVPPPTSDAGALPEDAGPPPPERSQPPAVIPTAPPEGETRDGGDDTAPPEAQAMPTQVGVGLGLHASAGTGVGPTAGAQASFELRAGSWSGSLEATVDLPTTRATAKGTIGTWLVAGALLPCVRTRAGWASACAAFVFGRVSAETTGVAVPRSDAFPWLAAGARLAADVPLAPTLALRIALDLLGTLTPYALELNGERVYASPPVSGSLGARMVYFF